MNRETQAAETETLAALEGYSAALRKLATLIVEELLAESPMAAAVLEEGGVLTSREARRPANRYAKTLASAAFMKAWVSYGGQNQRLDYATEQARQELNAAREEYIDRLRPVSAAPIEPYLKTSNGWRKYNSERKDWEICRFKDVPDSVRSDSARYWSGRYYGGHTL